MRKNREAKEQRQKTAKLLSEERSKRTDSEQIAKLDKQGYRAVKERDRLAKRIEHKHKIKKVKE